MTQLECGAVIFDLDGVLVDSTACIERHWRLWATKHGLDLEEILNVSPGRRTIETVRLVAPHLDAVVEATQLEADEAFDTNGVVAIEGAAHLLRSIPIHLWAIATSGTRDTATTRINHTGLPMPTILVTANDVTRGKPYPDPYLLAARHLRIAPNECVVVEDAPAGIQAALNAEMRVIGVATTHAASELTNANAVVSHIRDIQISDSRLQAASGLTIQLASNENVA